MCVAITSPLLFKIRIIRKDVILVAIISTPACISLNNLLCSPAWCHIATIPAIFQSLKVRSVVSGLTEASLKGGQERLRLFKSILQANTGRRLRLPLLASLTECYEFQMSRPVLDCHRSRKSHYGWGKKKYIFYPMPCSILLFFFFNEE